MPSRGGRFPPPPGDGPDTRRHHPRPRQQNNSSPNEGSSQPAGPSRKRMPSSEQANSRVARPRSKTAYRWVAKGVKQTPPVRVRTGEDGTDIGISAVLDNPTNTNGIVREIQNPVKAVQTQSLPPQANISLSDEVCSLLINPYPIMPINPNSILRNPNPITLFINQNPITIFNLTTNHYDLDLNDDDFPQMVQPISTLPPLEAREEPNRLQIIPFLEAQNNEDHGREIEFNESQSDGSPPGFEGPPQFGTPNDEDKPIPQLHKPRAAKRNPKKFLPPIRKSKHLQERYPDDRPRFGSSSKSIKKNVKKKLFNQNYLESDDPMTGLQAIQLVTEAGVELKEELADKVMQVVNGDGTGMEMVLFNEMEAPNTNA